jgi:hypothetical protein
MFAFAQIAVSLSSMVSFDNQTRNHTDIDITTRRVAVELSLRMSQAGTMGAVPTNATYMEALRFVGASFDMAMELPNYAVFNDNDTSTFAYSFNASSSSSSTTNKTADYKLVLEFTGPFDSVFYDPQFGLLVGSGTFPSRTHAPPHTHTHTTHTHAHACVQTAKAARATTASCCRCWCRCWWARRWWWWFCSPSASRRGSCGRSDRPTARTGTARAWSTLPTTQATTGFS